jgi:hypothetical protein
MSALLPKADIHQRDFHVRFGPEADSCSAAKNAIDQLVGDGQYAREMVSPSAFCGLENNEL